MYQLVQDFILNFSSILWEAMPFIVLGAVVAGVLEEFLPQQLIGKIMPKHPIPAVIIGGLLGLIFPMCECGIVVVMRRLLRKGLPLSSCVTYMLAGPIVNLVVLFSTYVAFGPHGIGWQMVALRAGIGFVVACGAGLVVHRLQQKSNIHDLLTDLAAPPKISALTVIDPEEEKIVKKPLLQRFGNIASTAMHDFLDITVFLILGALLAAAAKSFIAPDDLTLLSREMPLLAIPAMMLLAVVMCLCSEADAFVAASFTEMSVSSKISFLVLGPMLDLKLLMMYTRVFKRKLILTIVTCTVIQTLIFSLILHAFYNPATGSAASATTTAPTNSVATDPPK